MIRHLTTHSLILITLIGFTLAPTGCKKGKQLSRKAVAVFVSGKVFLERNKKRIALKVRDVVDQGDRIITKAKSTVTLQILGVGLVRLSAKSEFTLMSANKEEIRGQINKGSAGAKFKKRRKRTISLQTPTTVASVRGTTFGVAYGPKGQTTVSVTEGEVAVRPKASATQETILKAGQTTVVKADGKTKVRKINETEKKALAILEAASIGPDIIELSDEEAQKILEEFEKRESEFQNKKGKSGKAKIFKSIDEMKKAYDTLDEIVLFNGKKMVGKVIKQNNDFLFVQVPGGVKKIKKSDVSARNPLQ